MLALVGGIGFALAIFPSATQAPTPSQPTPTPRAVVKWATAAVEGDSTAKLQQRWTIQLAREGRPRAATFGLATLARLTYRYPEAERHYRALVQDARLDPFTAAGWLGLGYAAHPHGSVDSALARFAQAAGVAVQLRDSALAVEALIGEAGLVARVTAADSGLAILDQAEQWLTVNNQWGKAMLLCRRGLLLGNAGRPGGRAALEQGRDLARREGDRRLGANCDHGIATQMSQRGYVDSALEILADVANRQIRLRDRAGMAQSLQWSAFIRASVGSFGRAAKAAKLALAAADTSGNRSVRAWTLVTVSRVAALVQDFDGATAALVEAEALFRLTGDRSGTLAATTGRANIARGLGRYDQALELLSGAVRQSDRFFESWRPGLLRSMAGIRLAQDRPEAADSLLTDASRIAQRLRMDGSLVGIQFDQAATALRRGNRARAETILQAQLKHPDQATPGLRNIQAMAMASIALEDGRIDLAESLMVEAGTAIEVYRNRLSDESFRVLAFEVLDLLPEREFGFARLIAGLVNRNRLETAFELTEQRRARLLLDRLVRAAGPEDDSTALVETRKRRSTAPPAKLSEIQAGLEPNTAMLLYLTGGRGAPTSVFSVTRTRIDAAVLPPGDTVEALAGRLVRLLESGAPGDSLAAALGRQVLAPALANLGPEITTLIVVPDGPLHGVPFDVLRPTGPRILDRFAVVIAPSATVAVRRPPPPGTPRDVSLLAFGDPSFPAVPPLKRLPGTADEVRHAAQFANRPTVRIRAEASEAEFKRIDITDFRVLHFATHALIDADQPSKTYLALAAGAQHDGILLAADLGSRPLTADLVVLSACRTARGSVVSGEGVQGLTSPLLAAGAKSIVATLWSVEDRRAAVLIDLLYREMSRGQTVAGALREAKRSLARAGAPPRDWAGFVVVGDGQVTIPFQHP